MTVDVVNLLKRNSPHFALDVPSLHIDAGETVGLVGNNGAGKTTFLRLLLDLLRTDEGHILIDGEPVHKTTAWKARLGSYLDESFLLDFLTPMEFFVFVGNLYGMDQHALHTSLDPYRGFLSAHVFGSNPPFIRDLSMGNKKKVGIVAAMFIEPQLLILDEPFANLDPGSQLRLKAMLHALNETRGTTLLLSSHDLGHVTEVCRRIVVIDGGRLERDIRTSEATLHELEVFFTATS